MAEPNERNSPQFLRPGERGAEVMMWDEFEDVDEVIGVFIDNLLIIDILDGDGRQLFRGLFVLSFNSLHFIGLLNLPPYKLYYNIKVFYFLMRCARNGRKSLPKLIKRGANWQ
jgi:hypothetical protein